MIDSSVPKTPPAGSCYSPTGEARSREGNKPFLPDKVLGKTPFASRLILKMSGMTIHRNFIKITLAADRELSDMRAKSD